MRSLVLAASVLAVLLAMPVMAQESAVPQTAAQVRYSFAPLVKQAAPAVVNIYARRIVRQAPALFADPFFQQFFQGGVPVQERVENSLGSGVLVDSTGMVITNNHVVGDSEDIKVVLSDRREFAAKVLFKEPRTDLAVLALETKGERFPYIPLGDSERLEVGDMVLAIGNPFGVGQTVTSGIVSGLARTTVGISDYNFFIQTDAAINPGNSGGALIAMDGTLVGVNTAIFSRDGGSNGIGFAIPSTMVRTVLAAGRNGGTLRKAWLGAQGQPVTAEIASELGLPRPTGVLLNRVVSGSPADKAGLQEGDVLVAFNGKELTDPDALRFRLATTGQQDDVTIGYWRDGKALQTTATLAAAPEVPPRQVTVLQGQHPLAGIKVANMNPALAEELGMDADSGNGVVVLEVSASSFSRRFGLRPQDRIMAINGQPTNTVTALQSALKQGQGRGWQVILNRGGKRLTVAIQ